MRWASGTTEPLVPYMVGARAAGALTGLGLKIRDALTFLGLVLSGAWVLADIWQAVQDSQDETKGCDAKAADLEKRCSSWGKNREPRQRACCYALVAQGKQNCMRGIDYWPTMPWNDSGKTKVCVDRFHPEER